MTARIAEEPNLDAGDGEFPLPAGTPHRGLTVALGGLIVLMTAAAYWPVTHAGYIWDDDYYVERSNALRSLDGLRQIWFEVGTTPQYYPLVHTSYWIEYRFWQLDPTGYHVDNVLLHAACAILLWRVLRFLRVPGAWLAGALFALHPVNVESAAWITERKNVLSGVFYLGSALVYLRYALGTEDGSVPRRSRWLYAAALVLFLAALFSKTVTCTLPAALLLVLWWKRGRITWPDLRALLPFFVIGVAMGLLTIWMEKHHVGAEGAEWNLSPLDRCLLAGRVICFYAAKLLWPTHLAFIYPRWEISSQAWEQYLFPIAVVAVVVTLWFARRHIGRGPLVAVLFFAGTLTPALGFFDVYPMRYSYVADHFQYLASAGLIALVAASVGHLIDRFGPRGKAVATIPLVLVLAVLGILTWRQTHVYQNRETLWRDTLSKNPSAPIVQNNLAMVLESQGKADEAIKHYRLALRADPDTPQAHYNLARLLIAQGKLDEALYHVREALRIEPDYAKAHSALGHLLARRGEWGEAIAHCRRALELRPTLIDAEITLGTALRVTGQLDQSIVHFRRALELDPRSVSAHNGLGITLTASRRYDEAIEQFGKVLAIDPSSAAAYSNLGIALASQGKLDQAIRQFTKALLFDPDYPGARYNLAKALHALGHLDDAIAQYRMALRIAPNHPGARIGLGDALLARGRLDEALEHFRLAQKMRPNALEVLNGIAWILATHPDPNMRDPREALQLAERAADLTKRQDPRILDTLAAAYASNGSFERAAAIAEQALKLTAGAQDDELTEAIGRRLRLYQQKLPYLSPTSQPQSQP